MIVGQIVVCINDDCHSEGREDYTTWIKKGTTYVIRGVFLGISYKLEEGNVGLYLLGIHNPKSTVAPFPERGFNSERFKPIEEKSIPKYDEVHEYLPPGEAEPELAPLRRELVEV